MFHLVVICFIYSLIIAIYANSSTENQLSYLLLQSVVRKKTQKKKERTEVNIMFSSQSLIQCDTPLLSSQQRSHILCMNAVCPLFSLATDAVEPEESAFVLIGSDNVCRILMKDQFMLVFEIISGDVLHVCSGPGYILCLERIKNTLQTQIVLYYFVGKDTKVHSLFSSCKSISMNKETSELSVHSLILSDIGNESCTLALCPTTNMISVSINSDIKVYKLTLYDTNEVIQHMYTLHTTMLIAHIAISNSYLAYASACEVRVISISLIINDMNNNNDNNDNKQQRICTEVTFDANSKVPLSLFNSELVVSDADTDISSINQYKKRYAFESDNEITDKTMCIETSEHCYIRSSKVLYHKLFLQVDRIQILFFLSNNRFFVSSTDEGFLLNLTKQTNKLIRKYMYQHSNTSTYINCTVDSSFLYILNNISLDVYSLYYDNSNTILTSSPMLISSSVLTRSYQYISSSYTYNSTSIILIPTVLNDNNKNENYYIDFELRNMNDDNKEFERQIAYLENKNNQNNNQTNNQNNNNDNKNDNNNNTNFFQFRLLNCSSSVNIYNLLPNESIQTLYEKHTILVNKYQLILHKSKKNKNKNKNDDDKNDNIINLLINYEKDQLSNIIRSSCLELGEALLKQYNNQNNQNNNDKYIALCYYISSLSINVIIQKLNNHNHIMLLYLQLILLNNKQQQQHYNNNQYNNYIFPFELVKQVKYSNEEENDIIKALYKCTINDNNNDTVCLSEFLIESNLLLNNHHNSINPRDLLGILTTKCSNTPSERMCIFLLKIQLNNQQNNNNNKLDIQLTMDELYLFLSTHICYLSSWRHSLSLHEYIIIHYPAIWSELVLKLLLCGKINDEDVLLSFKSSKDNNDNSDEKRKLPCICNIINHNDSIDILKHHVLELLLLNINNNNTDNNKKKNIISSIATELSLIYLANIYNNQHNNDQNNDQNITTEWETKLMISPYKSNKTILQMINNKITNLEIIMNNMLSSNDKNIYEYYDLKHWLALSLYAPYQNWSTILFYINNNFKPDSELYSILSLIALPGAGLLDDVINKFIIHTEQEAQYLLSYCNSFCGHFKPDSLADDWKTVSNIMLKYVNKLKEEEDDDDDKDDNDNNDNSIEKKEDLSSSSLSSYIMFYEATLVKLSSILSYEEFVRFLPSDGNILFYGKFIELMYRNKE